MNQEPKTRNPEPRMFCDEALDAIEAIAGGELTPEGRIAQPLVSCRNCANALATARRVETMLRTREVPAPSSHFTQRTLMRVRRARWRTEQFLDLGFNLALGLIVLGVLGAVWMLMTRTGVNAVGTDAMELFGSAVLTLVRRAAPSVPLYAGATAVVATVLAIWWWAERGTAQ